jgi:CHAD domain-containing protein
MASDTAFRVLARRFLDDLAQNHEATCNGDPGALHQMRIALTRLRAAISFFSPITADTQLTRLKSELKRLNGHLGAARDLDVTTERLKAINKQRPPALEYCRPLEEKSAESHRRLTQTLRSGRYRQLVQDTYDWVENGPWSTTTGKQETKTRMSPVAAFSADKLMQWQKKLLKKSRKLCEMGTKQRHRLRLANKKLYYSTEFLEGLFATRKKTSPQIALKYLRQAQKSLGQLNDAANGRSLAATLRQNSSVEPRWHFLGPKRKRRLIKRATRAYRKLAEMKPFQT